MKVEEASLPGVLVITPKIHRDAHGSFQETFNRREMIAQGLPSEWLQDNFSVSRKNVLRGIGYQVVQPQGKLVRAAFGTVFDVAVDLRWSSPQFGKWVGMELSGDNGRMLWIPPGFGHAFLVLSEMAGFAYKTTDYYCPAGERMIVWNDPKIGIEWPIKDEPIISSKDAAATMLEDAAVYE